MVGIEWRFDMAHYGLMVTFVCQSESCRLMALRSFFVSARAKYFFRVGKLPA